MPMTKYGFSISNILPQLAEAAPEAILDNLEKELDHDTPSILVLFREGKIHLLQDVIMQVYYGL